MIVLLLCCILPLMVYRLVFHWYRPPLPPGPRGLPILGNALQLPITYTWLTFAELAQLYGDIIHVSVLGRSFIVLSSREAINDLLEKKGVIYSDRPIIPMAGELAGAARYLPMASYGSYLHREGRKLVQGSMNSRGAPSLQLILERKVARLMTLLSEDARSIRQHLRWFVASSVMQVSYGLDIRSWEHPLVGMIQEAMDDFSRMSTPGAWLVDSLPFLMHVPEWCPGAGFKKMARKARERGDAMKDLLYNDVKNQVARGAAEPSFSAQLIQDNPNASPEEEDLYKGTAVTLYAAGTDTTVSVLNSFFIVIANHPDVQRKAQSEIDRVVGNARMPSFIDRKYLPYLDAVLKEVYRINPVGPLGLPHKVRQEDYYRGYRIPTGATVLANTWFILHDPAVYPDPSKVDPERYLAPRNDSTNPDPREFLFGYGRRMCPGQMFADDMLFITAVNVLAQYDVSHAISLDGTDIKYDGNGIISHPYPWKCTLVRRKDVSDAQA